jgi:hypothetical protein
MNLEKLQQEAEALQKVDPNSLTPEQLTEFVDKLSSLLDQSEESLMNTTLIEVNKIENNEDDETDNS